MIKKRGKDIREGGLEDAAPGERSASGTKGHGNATLREKGKDAILGLIAACKRIQKPWDSAKRLFNHRRVDGVLGNALTDADLRLAIDILILAGLITFIMSLVDIVGSAYVVNAYSATIQDTIGFAQPTVGIPIIVPHILLSIIYLPVSILISLALGYCAFRILRMMGGKATFAQHLYLSSVVTLAAAFVTGLFIFFPIPCLNVLGAICLIIVNFYLAVIVAGRAYSIAHGIGPVPGFITALVVAVLNMAIILLLTNAVEGMLGLPPQLTIISDALKGA